MGGAQVYDDEETNEVELEPDPYLLYAARRLAERSGGPQGAKLLNELTPAPPRNRYAGRLFMARLTIVRGPYRFCPVRACIFCVHRKWYLWVSKRLLV